jgi:glucose/arabinose dehydrogenase
MRPIRCALVLAVLAATLVFHAPIDAPAAPSLPTGFSDELVAAVTQPTAIAFTPDGRMLVTSKTGALRIVSGGGALLATPAINLAARVCSNNERGLLGVAVDPSFSSNQFVYLYYTFKKLSNCPYGNPNAPVNRVSRFLLPATNVISPSSEVVLIDNIHSFAGNHNGGDLRFGKDGKLYVSVGDGGCDYLEPHGCAASNPAARRRHVMLGKMLRVNRDGTIPADNPFTGALSARCGITGSTTAGTTCREIYALGLRNPFRFAMDPNASSTRIYINDVGQGSWEEIDLGATGADYGWNVREGHCATGSTVNCGPPPTGMTNPVFDYDHSSGCASITGGAFVPSDSGWPASYTGRYLFADFVCGTIFRLDPSGPGFTMTDFATGLGNGTAVHMEFGPNQGGRALYYATFSNGGEIRRISFDPRPVAELTASPTTGLAPLTVTFDGSGSVDPEGGPLTYQWNFGDGDSQSTSSATIQHQYASNGTYTASLVVRDQTGLLSDPDAVTITVGNTAPVPTIASPAEGSLFSVGQSITLTGSATDAQDGALPASSLTWTVLRFHQDHSHPWVGPVSGNNITFTAPAPEDLAAANNSHLIVQLRATDSAGVSATVTRIVQPRTVLLTFRTNPTGLKIKVAGATFTAPVSLTSWAAWAFQIEAPSPQNGHVFVSWSDGGTRVHTITTPNAPATYTARFVKIT